MSRGGCAPRGASARAAANGTGESHMQECTMDGARTGAALSRALRALAVTIAAGAALVPAAPAAADGWGSPFTAADSPAGSPALAADDAGDVVLAWNGGSAGVLA